MSEASQRPTAQYTTGDLYIPVANCRIERALKAAGYAVKSHIITYPPGRAAVLPRVIVPSKAVRTW